MKLFLSVFLLFILQPADGQSKLQGLANEFCNCFDNLDYKSKSKAGNQLNKCINNEENDLQSQLSNSIESTKDYVEFIKMMGSNCKSFLEFATNYYYTEERLTDKEHTENLESLINYFRQPSEYGKLPKSVEIGVAEVGLRYNNILQKTYTDSVYRTGFHVINPNDSMIIFDIKEKSLEQTFDLLEKHDLSLRLKQIIRYTPKPDSLGRLIYYFGNLYEKRFLIPEFRLATRRVIKSLSSNQLYSIQGQKLTNRIIDSIRLHTNVMDYIDIRFLKITDIEFPHLIQKIHDAGLADTYELLQSQDVEERLSGLSKLFDNNSQTAYYIILDHWRKETDEEVKNFVLDMLIKE